LFGIAFTIKIKEIFLLNFFCKMFKEFFIPLTTEEKYGNIYSALCVLDEEVLLWQTQMKS